MIFQRAGIASLSRSHSSHILTSSIYNKKYTFLTSQSADTKQFGRYLKSGEIKIKKYEGQNNNKRYNYQKIIIPRYQPDNQEIYQKFQEEWKNKIVVVNVDASALMGFKRLFMKGYLEEEVYKGYAKPHAMFCEENPAKQRSVEQIKFDLGFFLQSDPKVQQQKQKLKGQNESEQLKKQVQESIIRLYESDEDRFSKRLKYELKVPDQYLQIIEIASTQQNEVYFCGINEYGFRNFISKYLSVNQIKQTFIQSLKYTYYQCLKLKNDKNIQTVGKVQQKYNYFAREYLYYRHFKMIKKVQNGQLLKRIRTIIRQKNERSDRSEKREQSGEENQKKGRKFIGKGISQKPNEIVLFAHSYTIQTLSQHVFISNLQSNIQYQTSKIPLQSQNIPSNLQKYRISEYHQKQTDADKIQKNAILQVMLGDLWNQPYTFNRFPYLSQDFNKLNQNDQQSVKNMYHQYLTKYMVAKRVFYQRNISKLDRISASQLEEQWKKYEEKIKGQEQSEKKKNQSKIQSEKKQEKIQRDKIQREKKQSKKQQTKKQKKKQQQGQIKYADKYEQQLDMWNNEIKKNPEMVQKFTKMLEQQLKQRSNQQKTQLPQFKIKRRGKPSAKKSDPSADDIINNPQNQ